MTAMNLYLITDDRGDDFEYDTFDEAVVCAPSEEVARIMHPSGGSLHPWPSRSHDGSWVPPERVTVRLIGQAVPGMLQGVVSASFNAG